MTLSPPSVRVMRAAWRHGDLAAGVRVIPEETAVAFTYDRSAHAVMMATPADLEDFAVGFSLCAGVVTAPEQIEALEIIPQESGIEVRISIARQQSDTFHHRRRFLAGPTGCGLCGIESLDEAMRPPPAVTSDLRLSVQAIDAAMASIAPRQILNRETSAVHAAGYWEPGAGLVALREDVGRHNALDKLAGAMARAPLPAARGLVALTSRVSVELVQKAAVMRVPVIAAVSAPTALAVRVAEAAGITLVAVARGDGFEVFSHAERIEMTVMNRST